MVANYDDATNYAKQLHLLPVAAAVAVVNALADDVGGDNSLHPNAVAVANIDDHHQCGFVLQVVLNLTKSSVKITRNNEHIYIEINRRNYFSNTYYLTTGRRYTNRMYGVFRRNTITLATVTTSMFVLCIICIANGAFSLAGINHKNFLHFTIIEVIQFSDSSFRACYQFQ